MDSVAEITNAVEASELVNRPKKCSGDDVQDTLRPPLANEDKSKRLKAYKRFLKEWTLEKLAYMEPDDVVVKQQDAKIIRLAFNALREVGAIDESMEECQDLRRILQHGCVSGKPRGAGLANFDKYCPVCVCGQAHHHCF
jgi:hypothetical protein